MFKRFSVALLWLALIVPALAQSGPQTCPTRPVGDSTNACASTAFVQALGNGAVKSVFGRTGVVSPVTGDYTVGQITGAAPLASPTFTGIPAAPTAGAGTNTTQLATTAFVQSAVGSAIGIQNYPTIAAATAATIPNTAVIYLLGATTAGDVGAGLWTRSSSLPSHTAYFQSADGAYWTPSLANRVFPFEMFGGRCGGTGFDNTPAFNKYISFNTSGIGQQRLQFNNCAYYFNTQPNSFNTSASAFLSGYGSNSTILFKNYTCSSGCTFLYFVGVGGLVITDMSIDATTVSNNGYLLTIQATSGNGASGSYLSNVTFSTFGAGDNVERNIFIDGSAKVSGSHGSRDHNWNNVISFGASDTSVFLNDVVGFTWMGGGLFPAGGTGTYTGGVQCTGPGAGAETSNVYIAVDAIASINMDQCLNTIIRASSISGGVFNTANTVNASVGGPVSGTKQTNWTTSNYTVN